MIELVTQRIKASKFGLEGLGDYVVELLKSPSNAFRAEDDIEVVQKFYAMEKADATGLSDGQVRHYITTGALDRDHEIMEPKGLDSKWYKKNPVVLWGHDYTDIDNIIGSNVSMTHDDRGVKAVTQFAMRQPKAAQIYDLIKDGHLRAWSVGFISVRGREPKKDEKLTILMGEPPKEGECLYIHEKWSLLEYSAVAVPSNPEALTEAWAKSYGLNDELIKDLEITMAKAIDGGKTGGTNDKTILDLGALGDGDGEGEEGKQKKKEKEGAEGAQAKPDGDCGCVSFQGGMWKGEGHTPVDADVEAEKDYVMKPLPNEHACRLKDPGQFDRFTRGTRDSGGKQYSIIFGWKDNTSTEQAYRYKKTTWTADEARSHCKAHKGSFEAASGGEAGYFYADVPLAEERVEAIKTSFNLTFSDESKNYTNVDYTKFAADMGLNWHDYETSGAIAATPWILERWGDDGGTADNKYTWQDQTWITWPPPDVSVTKDMWDNLMDQLKEMREELTVVKEGRILSGKNKDIINKAVDAMENAVDALRTLLTAAEPVSQTEPPKEAIIEIEKTKPEEFDLDELAQALAKKSGFKEKVKQYILEIDSTDPPGDGGQE